VVGVSFLKLNAKRLGSIGEALRSKSEAATAAELYMNAALKLFLLLKCGASRVH